MSSNDSHLIWLDLELTGLEPETDRILEIATIVTNTHLDIIAEGPVMAIHQTDDTLANMNAWCVKLHGSTGLTERCRQSKITDQEAEQKTLDFLSQYVKEGASPLCGNSVHQDQDSSIATCPTLLNSFTIEI